MKLFNVRHIAYKTSEQILKERKEARQRNLKKILIDWHNPERNATGYLMFMALPFNYIRLNDYEKRILNRMGFKIEPLDDNKPDGEYLLMPDEEVIIEA